MTRRILLIEDDPISQDIIRSLLVGAGYEVDVALDGFAGLERARATAYDALLIDYHLPEMDGYALGRLLREENAGSGTAPVLIGLTADRSGLAARRGADAVFKAILSKPIRPQDLFEAIERHCAAQPADSADARPVTTDVADLWRGHGLIAKPKAFVSPQATPEQIVALELCFDLVAAPHADLILLVERHGINEAMRACRKDGRQPLPVIGLSDDHADICDMLFRVNDPASWSRLATLLGAKSAPPETGRPAAPAAVAIEPVTPLRPEPAPAPVTAPPGEAIALPEAADEMDLADQPQFDLRPVVLGGICAPVAALRNRFDSLSRSAAEPALRAFSAGAAASLREVGLVADAMADFLNNTGSHQHEKTSFAPAEMAANAVAMISDTHESGTVLGWHAAPGLPQQLRGDAHRISQVLLTLLDDAASRVRGARFTLHIGHDDIGLTFSLACDAPGERVESPGDDTMEQLRSLRLAMATRLVGLMGGVISPAGKGAAFRFCMPATHEAAARPQPDIGTTDGARVLLLDQSVVSGQTLALLANQAGHHVCLVTDVDAAIFACTGTAYDLALIDLQSLAVLPEESLAALSRLAATAPHLPIVVLAGDITLQSRAHIGMLDIAGFIDKPCGGQALSAAIESFRVKRPGVALPSTPVEGPKATIDRAVHLALVDALGADTVAGLIEKLFSEIRTSADPQCLRADNAVMARLAALATTAAMFGLSEVSDCCAAFASGTTQESGMDRACEGLASAIARSHAVLGARRIAA